MLQNVFLILGLYILFLDGLTSLGINPTSVLVTLNRALKMLNEAHNSGHFNAPLKRKFAICFHFPSSAGVTPWANLGKASNNNHLLQVGNST